MAVVILMSGPPGSGKGTQAALLSAWLNIPSISTGELLRAEAGTGSALGRELDALFSRGEYASNDLVNRIVAARLGSSAYSAGVILDGYPRTRAQSLFLAESLTNLGWPDPWLIHLDISAESLAARLRDRLQCVPCSVTYNIRSEPPARPGLCDRCQRPLTPRSDDTPEVIADRIRIYTETDPADLNCWDTSRRLIFNGALAPDDVFVSIRSALAALPWPSRHEGFRVPLT